VKSCDVDLPSKALGQAFRALIQSGISDFLVKTGVALQIGATKEGQG